MQNYNYLNLKLNIYRNNLQPSHGDVTPQTLGSVKAFVTSNEKELLIAADSQRQ
jgi:hypothetical protein